MKLSPVKTINHLEIKKRDRKHETNVPAYVVFSPDGRALEEFRALSKAEQWCKRTTDFLSEEDRRRESWVRWLENYGARKFLDMFMGNAHGAESTCIHCGEPIYLDLLEGGGVADWKTEHGDYGCEDSPDTCSEGTGGHAPKRLEDD